MHAVQYESGRILEQDFYLTVDEMWNMTTDKRDGWRGRIYSLTDSDTVNYFCLQPSTALTSTPAKPTSSSFQFCQGATQKFNHQQIQSFSLARRPRSAL